VRPLADNSERIVMG